MHERLVREGRVGGRVGEVALSHLRARLLALVTQLVVDVSQVAGQELEVVRVCLT